MTLAEQMRKATVKGKAAVARAEQRKATAAERKAKKEATERRKLMRTHGIKRLREEIRQAAADGDYETYVPGYDYDDWVTLRPLLTKDGFKSEHHVDIRSWEEGRGGIMQRHSEQVSEGIIVKWKAD